MRTHGKIRYHPHNAFQKLQVAYARATLGLGIDSIIWSAMHDASMSLLQVDWLHAKLPKKWHGDKRKCSGQGHWHRRLVTSSFARREMLVLYFESVCS